MLIHIIIGIWIFVFALLAGLLWSKMQRKKAVEAAYEQIKNEIVTERDSTDPLSSRTESQSRRKPFVLVATFDNDPALKQAVDALAAAKFTGNDYVCLCGDMRARAAAALGFNVQSSYEWSHLNTTPAADVPRDFEPYVRELFSSGRPIVLVRTTKRFPQACAIIESAGGRIGCRRG